MVVEESQHLNSFLSWFCGGHICGQGMCILTQNFRIIPLVVGTVTLSYKGTWREKFT